ncbi:hypothetical protein [Lunatimonas salinarum]|uniref:hypothetical protein n=1 Tax=Lunatimonas salinarum TaxID=1774590 RepID=UPI001AE0B53B|nr:hypothetical protein [Lunatimonas salinarum]
MIAKDIEIKVKGTLLILLIIAILSILPREDRKIQSNECRWSNNMKSEAFDGIIIRKFDDAQNHYMPTLLIDQGQRNVKMVLQNEISGFYSSVQIGDLIRKKPNTLSVEIIRNNWNVIIILDYGCLEE